MPCNFENKHTQNCERQDLGKGDEPYHFFGTNFAQEYGLHVMLQRSMLCAGMWELGHCPMQWKREM